MNLASLLLPVTPEVFFRSHWPGTPLFIPPSAGKLAALFDLPQLRDVESLLAVRVERVRACLPDFEDEFSSVMLAPPDALKAYRNDMTLVFDSMQSQCKTIADTLTQLRDDLGLPTGGHESPLTHSRSMAYATPAGGRTRLHFDANANFVVQIRGTKRWWLAPNTSVENPTERYTSGSGELAVALESQCHAPLLDRLPDDCPGYLLEPGAVLFVPRGYWHETMTDEDSLSLNFTFSQPTWADVVAESLRQQLLSSAPWRELADGLEAADPARRESALARLHRLMAGLGEEFASAERLATEVFARPRE